MQAAATGERGMDEAEGDDQRLRLIREIADTRQRVGMGGLFYLIGWAVVGGVGQVAGQQPLIGALVTAAFLLLAVLRFAIRAPATGEDIARQRRWIDRIWGVVLATAALWGAVLAWALLDDAFAPARTAALLCSIAYATAYAHNFSMRRRRALLGIVLLYLPAPVLLALDPANFAVALTMAVYFIYVVLILYRSHGEYLHRLDLDDQLRHQRDQYERLSRTDALTGLANRRHFGARLEALAAESQRGGAPLSLLVLDLDHFKAINDALGHDAGDACLARFAERMGEHLALPGAHLARLGGEEFAALLPGMPAGVARDHAEALRTSLVLQPLALREGTVTVSVSIGVAEFQAGGDPDGADLYRAADRAMYRAKSEGRNRVRVDGD